MDYKRMPIEIESPEMLGYSNVKYNLAESSVRDTHLNFKELDLNNLVLCYGDHLGKPELRTLLASEAKNINANNVLLTPSAATALFIVATTLLEKDSHLIVAKPNYATNIETPRAIGCEISFVNLTFENNFKIDWDNLASLIKPNTKLISLTHPHNPTGICFDDKDFEKLSELANNHNIYILVDETYRELIRKTPYAYACDLNFRIISVASMSKAFGLPGIRIGWIMTQDNELFEKFLAAKEQILICNSVVDEEIAYQFYKIKKSYLAKIIAQNLESFNVMKNWMAEQKNLEWIEPQGGVVSFPRIKEHIKIDYSKFYSDLNSKFETFVGPGHWFEMPMNYMRIGFGYPLKDKLINGLKNINKAIELQINL